MFGHERGNVAPHEAKHSYVNYHKQGELTSDEMRKLLLQRYTVLHRFSQMIVLDETDGRVDYDSSPEVVRPSLQSHLLLDLLDNLVVDPKPIRMVQVVRSRRGHHGRAEEVDPRLDPSDSVLNSGVKDLFEVSSIYGFETEETLWGQRRVSFELSSGSEEAGGERRKRAERRLTLDTMNWRHMPKERESVCGPTPSPECSRGKEDASRKRWTTHRRPEFRPDFVARRVILVRASGFDSEQSQYGLVESLRSYRMIRSSL